MDGDPKKRILLLAVMLLFVIGLVFKVFKGTERPATEEFDYLVAKAEELDRDPARIIEFVERQVAAEEYRGKLRGPVGTLFSGAGNDVDRAALLAALLREVGSTVRFARKETTWLQLAEESGWRDLLSGPGDPSWTGEELPEGLDHRLTISLRRSGGDGLEQSALELRTAEIAPHLLELRFENGEAILRLEGTDRELRMMVDRSKDETLTLVFAHLVPEEEKPRVFTREVYTRRHEDYLANDDPRNRHVIAIAPWRLPNWAYEKEIELIENGSERTFSGEPARDAALLALSYLRASDEGTAAIAKHFEAACYFTQPRVIVASVTFAEGGETAVSVSLDLRSNSITTEGEEGVRAAVGVTRSTFEAGLEAEMISAAAGKPSLSALPILQQLFDRLRPSTPERLRLYASSLERLGKEARPGARLLFRTDPGRELSFELESGGQLKLSSMSAALEEAMERWPGDWDALSMGKSLAEKDLGAAALELELLFGPASGAALDYRPEVEVQDSLQELVGPDSRIFLMRKHEDGEEFITLEYQIQSVEGDVRYESIDYWDEAEKKAIRSSLELIVPAENVKNSHLLSRHYSNSLYRQGGMFLFASRAVRKELKTKGETVIRYQHADGTTSDEIKLFLTDEVEQDISVNNRKRKATMLYAAGSYLKDNPTKKTWKEVDPIESGDKWKVLTNKWVILDNEQFPLIGVAGSRFQSVIPGRVISAGSGLGVPDARIVVEGTNARSTSWADGRVQLPVVKQAFGEFTVTVDRHGYEPVSTVIDFSKPDAFPLEFKLTPRPEPDDFVWLSAKDLEAGLGALETTERVRGYIRTALTENESLVALVPKARVEYGGSLTHAWLLFDSENFHITGVTEDGLHGSSIAGGMVKDWVKNSIKAGFGKGSPYDMQQGAINAFSGYIASWYAYSAGKLDVLSQMMEGEEFDDLGHASAMKFALDFLKGMQGLKSGLSGGFAKLAGYKNEQFEAGFMQGLKFFDSNPVFRGE